MGQATENVEQRIESLDFRLNFLHGDLDQNDRMTMMREFRANKTPLLIATDVASRGLDIPNIRTVLSYNAACNIETHTHRIGRTGRAGEKGVAITLLTTKEKKLAAHLVEQLETQQQKVPNELMQLALSFQNFRTARGKGGLMST